MCNENSNYQNSEENKNYFYIFFIWAYNKNLKKHFENLY